MSNRRLDPALVALQISNLLLAHPELAEDDVLRADIRLRKQDADERKEHDAILETYMHALGML